MLSSRRYPVLSVPFGSGCGPDVAPATPSLPFVLLRTCSKASAGQGTVSVRGWPWQTGGVVLGIARRWHGR